MLDLISALPAGGDVSDADVKAAIVELAGLVGAGSGVGAAFATNVGDGSSTSIAITHNLGTRDVLVEVYDRTTNDTVIANVVRTSTSVVTLGFQSAPALNALRVLVRT